MPCQPLRTGLVTVSTAPSTGPTTVAATSRTSRTTGASMASRTSSVVVTMVLGRPVMRSRPRISACSSSSRGQAEASAILTSSAVRWPTARPYSFLKKFDDGGVVLGPRHADRRAGDDAPERDHRHLARAAADVDDHVACRLLHREPRTDGGGHGLLDDVCRLAGPGVLGRLLHRPLLDAGDARGNADDHPRLAPPPVVRLADEVAEHLLADLEVRDDTVLERPDRLDVAGRAPDHALGLDADRDGSPVAHVDGNDRGFVEHDALATPVDHGVGRAEIDRHVPARP